MHEKVRQSTYNIIIPLSAFNPEYGYLVSNPLYGNASLITQREYDILTKPHTHDTISQFKDEGYLTTLTEEEETQLMEKRYEDQKNPLNPRTAIVVTYACNLRCTYCWTDFLFDTFSAIIDKKTVDPAFNTIPQIPALQSTKSMSLYGGEPFLPSTHAIVTYIRKKGSDKGYTFHANTNGYYLSKFVPLLAQHAIEGLGVTLDGWKPVHDARRKKT